MGTCRPILVCPNFFGALRCPIGPNVRHLDSLVVEHPCDQEEAVALGRVFLAAHHHNSILTCSIEQTIQSSPELRRLGHPTVEHVVFRIVELRPIRATAEFFAQEHVLDASFSQAKLQVSAIELRIEA